MFKKLILLVILVIILIGIGYLVSQPKTEIREPIDTKETSEEKTDEEEIQIANPASVYCEEEGGTLEIRETVDGQRGFCLFEDGSECDEWDFFRLDCKKGEVFCKDLCGDGICQEIVCTAVGCPCPETPESCPQDCFF